jgi:hypothetical protein
MRRPITAAALAALAAAATLGAAQATTQQLPWRGSASLDIAVPGRVTITEGPTARIVVSGPQSALDKIRFDGERLRYKRSWWTWFGWDEPRGLRIEITAPALQRLAVHAGSNVRVVNLSSDSLSFSVHSGADLDGQVTCRAMSAEVHSGADLRLTGRAERLDLAVHSGADADLGRLSVDYADVRAHSGADAIISPRLSVKANAHSGADIRLLQRPAHVEAQTHSGGGVRIP